MNLAVACQSVMLTVRTAVTFPTAEYHRPLDNSKLHCLMCEQPAQNRYIEVKRARVKAAISDTRTITVTLLLLLIDLYSAMSRMEHESKRCDGAEPS